MRDTEALARKFHEAYERLASEYGYETREETREFDPESPNGKLMLAVCDEIMQAYLNPWISVEERLPEHNQEILVIGKSYTGEIQRAACKIDAESFDYFWLGGCGFDGYEWEYDFEWKDVTDWMPLPNPPKE